MCKAIGVFDSGVGGLTVLKSLMEYFPNEKFIYLGDTARVPYGTKGTQTVVRYAIESSHFLLSNDVKLIVVACNTASSVALEELNSNFNVPIIGVVEPSSIEAYEKSKNKVIAVLGTKRTIQSKSYITALKNISKDVVTHSVACPLFVPLVEEGWCASKVAEETVKTYLESLKKSNVDAVILGCTHYPLLKEVIQKQVGKDVLLIESGEATAKEVDKILNSLNIKNDTQSNKQDVQYFVTDDANGFDEIAKQFIIASPIRSKKIDL